MDSTEKGAQSLHVCFPEVMRRIALHHAFLIITTAVFFKSMATRLEQITSVHYQAKIYTFSLDL